MPICSYLVIPGPGGAETLAARLAAIPGCDVARAENRDLLILVTETAGIDEETALRGALERVDGIHAMLVTFGEIEPGARQPRDTP